MLTNLPLWAKFFLAMFLSIALVGGVLSYANLRGLEEVIAAAERQELDNHIHAITTAIGAEARRAETLSALVAGVPQFQHALATGDRETLKAQFVPSFEVLKRGYGIEQFQFHTPPATSFLRVHNPAKFGDDLSDFRHTVVDTNENKRPTRGIEIGVAGLGVRGIVPMFQEGQHIGSVEFGAEFGQSFFDSFKAQRGVDVALYIQDGAGFKAVGTTLSQQSALPAETLRQALGGAAQVFYLMIEGKPHVAAAQAVDDYSGRPVGVVAVMMDRGSYDKALSRARSTALLVGIGALGLGLLLAVLTARGMARRIAGVVVGVNRVAQGDLTQDIQDHGSDEIGLLTRAANSMRQGLHGLAVGVRDHTETIRHAAEVIADSVESQAATSSQMSASIAEITSTMEELSATSSQIAEHAQSVADIAHRTWETSQEGSQAMGMVMQKMEEIRGDTQHSLGEIKALGGKSKEIGKVMEIINAVADQTKLIAFNAALEAASAGDAGRRFSVVAAEIRRLADSVTESTGEIAIKVNEIQEAINRLVITSEKGAHGIEAGMNASSHTADRLAALEEAARQTTGAAQQISLSTQQQRTASDQVVVALIEIVNASTHTAESIQRVSEVSKRLTEECAELGGMVGQFKIKAASAGESSPA